jgi:hypothetical protein
MKPLKSMREDVKEIAIALDIDRHLLEEVEYPPIWIIMVAQTRVRCSPLNEISFLTKADRHITSISSGQLSVVNKNRALNF